MSNPAAAHALEKMLEVLVGQPCWLIRMRPYHRLVMDLGSKIADISPVSQKPFTRGEWRLQTLAAYWRFESQAETVVGSGDEDELISARIGMLQGLVVKSIQVVPPALDLVMAFSDQQTLRLFGVTSQQHPQWRMITPTGEVITVEPKGVWTLKGAEGETPLSPPELPAV
ncbi:hypothetical protein ANRL4_01728 [Anaerolineae bacterium]|nr:hypothetical protein ANRL4_01728 [Anaerolineae bacterium]